MQHEQFPFYLLPVEAHAALAGPVEVEAEFGIRDHTHSLLVLIQLPLVEVVILVVPAGALI